MDVDDMMFAMWNYEVFSNWVYNLMMNVDYVNG